MGSFFYLCAETQITLRGGGGETVGPCTGKGCGVLLPLRAEIRGVHEPRALAAKLVSTREDGETGRRGEGEKGEGEKGEGRREKGEGRRR